FDCSGSAEDGARGGCTERDDEGRAEQRELAFEPLMAGADLQLARLLVDATFAARLELEVLDRIRHVRRLAVDRRVGQRAVQELAGWPYERLARPVLLV